MPIPSPRLGVPRNEVHEVLEFILMNHEVGDVLCLEQHDGTYIVKPSGRSTREQDED